MKTFFTILFTLSYMIGFSQKETSHWFLGDSILLHFTDKGIVNDKTNLSSTEGCAAISNKDGKLLFWGTPEKTLSFTNKSFKTIGHQSSTQGIIFITHPANDSLVFSFTSYEATPYFNSKLAFHIYKTNGDSLALNKILWNSVTEKLHACNHQNNKDIWIATHDSKSDSFIFYMIKKDGLLCCPVYQKIGYNYYSGDFPKYNAAGQLKFSPNGKYISTGILGIEKVELFLFNNESGKIINNSKIDIVMSLARGLEYDFKSNFLFLSTDRNLHQYSLKDYNQQKILNSHKIIASYKKGVAPPLQLAMNNKIYMSNLDSSAIASIEKKYGSEDTFIYKEKGFIPTKGKCQVGLPSFNANYFHTPSIDYSYEQDCRTNTIAFEGQDTIKATSYKWFFSNGTKTDTKATKDASYTFTDTGKWQVKYIATNGSRMDTVTKTITIKPKLEQGFLGEDKSYCQTLPTLNAPKNLHCIHWYNDAMTELSKIDSFKPVKEGTYYAKATNLSFCVEWDTIKIVKSTPKADFETSDVCESDSVVFVNTSGNANNYTWKFGDLKTTISESPKHKYQITTSTTFNVTLIANNDGCTDSITKPVTINQNPSSDFTFIQTDNTFDLKANKNGLKEYKWVFGKTDSITKTINTHTQILKANKTIICLTVTDLLGCTSQSCTTATIGIQSILNANEIKIYPNPSKGKLTIEISRAGNYNLKVYDEIGKLVLEKMIKGNHPSILLLKEAKGNYLMEIVDEDGRKIVKKVIVE